MKNKISIIFLIISILTLIVGTLLTIFSMPNKVPILFDINENIELLSSKWITIIAYLVPICLTFAFFISKKENIKFLIKVLFITSIFEIIIFAIYYSFGSNFEIGQKSEIYQSISIFMPLSAIIIVYSIKIKNIPYLTRPSLYFKKVRETDFIWIQTHFYASNVYSLMGVLLFLTSIIFTFTGGTIAEVFIFAFAILLCTFLNLRYASLMYKKYIDMKKKRDNLDKIKLKSEK